MKIYLFDTKETHENLLPLSFTRPVGDFRCGILTIKEKWEKYIPGEYFFHSIDYLQPKYGAVSDANEKALFIAGNLLPDFEVVEEIKALENSEGLQGNNEDLIAFKGSLNDYKQGKIKIKKPSAEFSSINFNFDIFLKNGEEIKKDFDLITRERTSQALPSCVRVIGEQSKYRIFIEEGATIECASININEGPVYIGKDSVLMEGACIRGPFALCEGSEIRMGAKVYEETTIGPHCKAGGEISNTVFFGYSNKAHDGYLGNAVIGEWCNIGAGTNASNLKNDYSLIRVWNYRTRTFMRTNLQFCGLIMGDHSKIGVNCMINTATVIGVGVNIHGAGFPRTFVPCFCEGSPVSGFVQVPLKKFLSTAERVMDRRDMVPSKADIGILTHIYDNHL